MLGNQISLTNNVAKQVISVIATTNGQQDFTVEGGYRINQLGVYRNGVRLVDGRDFTARDGATVRLVSQGVFAGDAMEFVVFDDFRVADALSVNAGGTVNASVNITGALQLGTGTSIFSPADNTLTLGTNDSERIRVGAAGSVGIGTDNPAVRLEIVDSNVNRTWTPTINTSLLIERNSNCTISAIGDTTSNCVLNFGDSDDENAGSIDYDHADDSMSFRVNGGEKLLITSTGRILQKSNNENIDMDATASGQLNLDGVGYNAALALNAEGLNIYHNSASRGIIFGTNETERVRIASNGNVGINESDPLAKLHIDGSNDAPCLILPDSTNSRFSVGFGNINVTGVGQRLDFYAGDSGSNTANLTSAARRMSLTSQGRLGIGTDTPDERLHIFTLDDTPALEIEQGTINQRAQIRFNSPEVGSGWIVGTIGGAQADHGHFIIYQASSTASNGHLQFYTNNVQHFNIDHAGRIDHFCTDSNGYDIHTSESGAADTAFAVKNAAGSITDGTQVMFIRADGDLENTNNAYGAISDAKLKENIVDASSQWNDIKSLQVRNYNFKESTGFSTHTQLGVVAQEIETISPGLVDDTPDLDNDGNDLGTVTKTVNYSVLYMKSVKALQEAMNRIETLESKVAALEGN